MKPLFDNRFAPFTYSIGFLNASFAKVVSETLEWKHSLSDDFKDSKIESPLHESLRLLEPLVTPPQKFLLWATQGPWVAYFDHGILGGDPASFIGYMAERLKCWGVAATWKPDRDSALVFKLYAPEKRDWLNIERSISLINDCGSYSFKTTGTVQPYEQPERYGARLLKDRFTPQMLVDYCDSLEIRLIDEGFYSPVGHLIEQTQQLSSEFVPLSLAEARRKLGIER